MVENIGGGGGSVGAAQAARARPDGYTILLGGATTHVTEALLKNKPAYDALKDFEPISRCRDHGVRDRGASFGAGATT